MTIAFFRVADIYRITSKECKGNGAWRTGNGEEMVVVICGGGGGSSSSSINNSSSSSSSSSSDVTCPSWI